MSIRETIFATRSVFDYNNQDCPSMRFLHLCIKLKTIHLHKTKFTSRTNFML